MMGIDKAAVGGAPLSDVVKEMIAREIAGFLILDTIPPEAVQIHVQYPGGTAKKTIHKEEIERVLRKGVRA